MAARGEIYYGPAGDEILISTHANEVQREFEEGGSDDRTLDGSLKTDIMWRKYTFIISNNWIDQDTLDSIYERHSIDDPMNLRMWITDTVFFKNFDGLVPVVRLLPFKSTDFPNGGIKRYKDVKLTFIEV